MSVEVEATCITDDEALALLEQRLAAAERQRIDRHLDTCEACRELVSALAIAGDQELDDEGPDDQALIDIYEDGGSLTRERIEVGGARREGSFERGALVGPYRIMRLLGRGGMGQVYLARDTHLGRRVALKVIAADLVKSPKAMERFLFEARATARFNHPHIVTIHAVGEHKGRPWVALEYVEGDNLRLRLDDEQLGLTETLRIGLAVAEALVEAHARGILHRDLKPANVVIGDDGRVRVVDFGLAKAVLPDDDRDEEVTRAISSSAWLVGTPRYMAPEQWRGGETTGAADVWSLGVMLFEACAGRRPFEADSAVELLQAVTSDVAAPRLQSLATVPVRLAQLVDACLAKDSTQRPDASEVVTVLRDLIEAEQQIPTESPFRGLLPFSEQHAAFFFGREAESSAFVERLRHQPVLPLVGPSGAGKTSFIQAGVVPRLRDQHGWLVLPLRPGNKPFTSLAARLALGDPKDLAGQRDSAQWPSLDAVEEHAERLRDEPRGLALELRNIASEHGRRVLVVVDQLEELFTLVDDEEEQRRFLVALTSAADDVDDPVRVVVILRHDFIDRLALDDRLARQLGHFAVLRPPDEGAMVQILEEPVRRAGYRYEDADLVPQIVSAVRGEPACLPLLQFTASRLWERRREADGVIPRSAYEEMGGVGGALAHHADGIIDGLPRRQRRLARALLLRLVTAERTRRVIAVASALDGLGSEGETVLDRLAEARLVTITRIRRDEPMVELAHESLIHTWRTLAQWIDQTSDELRVLADATQAAELWKKRGEAPESLWQGQALVDLRAALARPKQGPTPLLQAFADASEEHAERDAKRRRRGRLAAVAGLALVAAAGLVTTAWVAGKERDAQAARERAEALERQAQIRESRALLEGARHALAAHPLEARARLRLAWEIADSTGARTLWRELSRAPVRDRIALGAASHDVAFCPDRRRLAVATRDRLLVLHDLSTGEDRMLSGMSDAVTAVAWVNATTLITGDRQGSIVEWRDGEARPLATLAGGVERLAVATDGRVAAAGATAVLLSGPKRTEVTPITHHTGGVTDLAFTHRGALVTAGRDGKVVVSNRRGKAHERLETTHPVVALALDGPGGRVGLASHDGTITLWTPGGSARRFSSPAEGMSAMAIDAAGERLVATSGRMVRLWDLESGRLLHRFEAKGPVRALAFGSGHRLAVSADDEVVVLDVRRLGERDRSHEGAVHDVDLSPDETTVASAGGDGTIRLWSVAGQLRHVLRGHDGPVTGVRFLDGETLVSVGLDGTLRQWNQRSGLAEGIFGGPLGSLTALAVDAEGDRLAVGTASGWVQPFDGLVPRGKPLGPLTGGVEELRFSGRALTAVTDDHVLVRLPDLGAPPEDGVAAIPREGPALRGMLDGSVIDGEGRSLVASGARVEAVASREGWLGVGRADGTLSLVHGEGELLDLFGHRGPILAVALGASGKRATSASQDGSVRMWDLEEARPAWRGIALLGQPPRLVSHRGWEGADGIPRHPPEGAWANAVVDASFATQNGEGNVVCVVAEGAVVLWDPRRERPLHTASLEPRQVVALPSGCAVRGTDGGVTLVRGTGEPSRLDLPSPARAIGWGEQRVLVVTEAAVLSFTESGEPLGEQAQDASAVTAVTQLGTSLVLGSADGRLTVVGTEASGERVRLERATAAAVLSLVASAAGTVVSGYADGTVALHGLDDGAVLADDRLHGAVVHLRPSAGELVAATDLGDQLRWDLTLLERPYCKLLQTVWREVAVVWERGRPTPRPPPPDHPCRR